MSLAADAVELAMEVLDRRRVSVVEVIAEKARHERRLADTRRPEQDQPVAVSRRDVGVFDDQPRQRGGRRADRRRLVSDGSGLVVGLRHGRRRQRRLRLR